jgi:hypothetical protein
MFRPLRGRTLLLLAVVLCAATAGTLAVALGDEDGPRARLARAATESGCARKSAATRRF